MNLASKSCLHCFYRGVLFGAMFIALAGSNALAAELVMFEQAGCAWCAAFNREIAPVYGKTQEGLLAPLRRVDIAHALPPELGFIEVERLTPLFVLIDKGREIGRIRGYPGKENFWGLLGALVRSLDKSEPGGERTHLLEKTLHSYD